jgi:hypothetical protein
MARSQRALQHVVPARRLFGPGFWGCLGIPGVTTFFDYDSAYIGELSDCFGGRRLLRFRPDSVLKVQDLATSWNGLYSFNLLP